MPPNGTIDFKFRVRQPAVSAAVAALSRAGFISRSEGLPDDEMHVVIASRYAGVPSPDGDTQAAHRAAAAATLTAAGIQAEPAGSGVTIQGHTNPALASGMLRRYDGELPEISADIDRRVPCLGTCFALWHVHTLVTAAHCVNGLSAGDLCVQFPHAERLYPAAEVLVHPEADLAVVRLDQDAWPQQVEAFTSLFVRLARSAGPALQRSGSKALAATSCYVRPRKPAPNGPASQRTYVRT